MKLILLLLSTSILILTSCSDEHEVEDELYQCLSDKYNDEGVNFEKALDELEEQLIKEGILSDRSGQAKINYYETIVEKGVVTSLKDDNVIKPFLKINLAENLNLECRKALLKKDSLAFMNSKYHTTVQKIQMRAVKNGGISPVTVSKAIIEELSAEDFEHPFYRMFMLVGFAMAMDKDTAFIRKIPDRIDQIPDNLNTDNGIVIKLKDNDSVIINDQMVHLNSLSSAFEKARSKGPKAPIFLYVQPQTKYAVFIQTQTVIEEYITRVREQEAQRSFHKSYNELTPRQKINVDDAHPMIIIERKY